MAFALCTDAYFVFGLWSAFDCLNGVAHQIGENARKLFMVGIHQKFCCNIINQFNVACLKLQTFKHIIDNGFEHEHFAPWRHFLCAAICEGLIEENNGAVKRCNQLWRKALHALVFDLA